MRTLPFHYGMVLKCFNTFVKLTVFKVLAESLIAPVFVGT